MRGLALVLLAMVAGCGTKLKIVELLEPGVIYYGTT
jgi:hypothetical protein